jgi:aspartate/methionine/tyrosine aminotransferase
LNDEARKPGVHGYQSYNGSPVLRNAFADWYRKYFSVELNPESEILPLMGSKEGIMHVTMAFVNPDDEVLVPNPGYPTYSSVTSLAYGKSGIMILMKRKGGFRTCRRLKNQI